MVVKSDKERKLVTIDKKLWADIENIRFSGRFKTEAEVMRYLLNLGVECHFGAEKENRKGKKG
jgi:Arc/MetJ-type ribon-helix-helix transcriptional regulator